MSNFLDYNGLEHYNLKLKESIDGAISTSLELIQLGLSRLELHLTYQDGSPAKYLMISGMQTKDGNENIQSNKNGVAIGYIKGTGKTRLSISYFDAVFSQEYDFVIGKSYTIYATVTKEFSRTYLTSSSGKFSQNVTSINVIAVGGGGGGGTGKLEQTTSTRRVYAGNGGKAGEYSLQTLIVSPELTYQIAIGSGGYGGHSNPGSSNDNVSGSDGGSTSFGSLLTVSGGTGGKADKPENCAYITWNSSEVRVEWTPEAGSSLVRPMSEIYCGGSGGGGGFYIFATPSSGPDLRYTGAEYSSTPSSPGGGKGGNATTTSVEAGKDAASGCGSGGGGGALTWVSSSSRFLVASGGNGNAGAIKFEMNFKD